MSHADQWNSPIYALPCPECGKVSHKSFLQLETEDRLPCDHCPVSINVADYYGSAELYAIAVSLGSPNVILRERKKSK